MAAVGVVIQFQDGTIKKFSKCIGEATNNIAEYSALIYALEESLRLKVERLKVHTDSELLFRQLTGSYKIKNDILKTLFNKVKSFSKSFEGVDIQHVPREQNHEADCLASEALKGHKHKTKAKVVASLF